MSNRKPEQKAAPEAAPEATVLESGLKIETQFEIVDNTAAEAAPEREPEATERSLDNGMTVVDYV